MNVRANPSGHPKWLLRWLGSGSAAPTCISGGGVPSIPPVTLGHEICGAVVDVGPEVERDPGWLNKRVAVETSYSTCRTCRYCRTGRPNLCFDRLSLGSQVDGGMAPFVVVPVTSLHNVPPDLGDPAATLSEPLACICNSMMDPGVVQPGDTVLVVGPGAMGLLAAQVARCCGGPVIVRGTGDDDLRLSVARELGFEVSVAGAGKHSEDVVDKVDVVVECSGSEPGVRDALEAVRRGGTLGGVGLRRGRISVSASTSSVLAR